MPLSVGSRLGPHEILHPLGTGGMGEVYRARDSRLGREVAIKVLPRDLAADPERLARFEQEARSASALNHPSIVTIYEVGQVDATFYIVMELVEGTSWRELVASGPVPLRKLLSIASQAADGLAKAHAAGIVHRDLKPENLMLSRDGFVKILDFGLAKLVSSPSDDVSNLPTFGGAETGAGVILGTVGYMSPEQATGRAVDFRSDQFSFGSVLYEMASGKRAFHRETAVETLAAIIQAEPKPVASVNPGIPAPLSWIIERCHAKEPAERYDSTQDLARDLAAVRKRLLEAPPEARARPPMRLPVQRTRFVGRDPERRAVKELLLREDVRLITLTGPGGIGKTRLALQVAEEMVGHFPGGVSFVSLASVNAPDQIASTISHTLGVRERGGQAPLETLREHIASLRAPMLLLLDNLEQLASEASMVGDVVAIENVKVISTSRSPLRVYGEHEFPVPPLGLPDPRALPPLEALSEYESIALFLQRAIAVKPDFALTKENAAAIAEICARLDGLPLAIELAAARIKLLAPSAMRSRIEKRLQLSTGGSRDLPARQQTLRGAIEWSYDLLNPAEQGLFGRLAVFAGGCALEAVEAVCNARGDLEVEVLDGMESMVDKSLVRSVEPVGGDPRFVMLETIGEYAMERLARSGDESITRRAHAAYCLVLAEEVGTESSGEGPTGWLERFDLERENFRAALDWLTETGQAEWGLRLGAALFRYWESREHILEGRSRLAKLLALPGAQPRTKERARALFAAGVLAGVQRDFVSARMHVEESLEINRERDDKWGAAVSVNSLAVTALDHRDVAAARRLSEENLALWRELGDRAAVARSLSNLASVVAVERDFELAHSLYEEALSVFRELADHTSAARVLDKQGDVAREQGNSAAAQALYEQSLTTFRQFGDLWGIAGTLADLGNLALDRRDHSAARRLFRESLRIFQGLEFKRGIAQLLECFAGAAADEGQPERALELAGASAALRQSLGTPMRPAEQAQLEKRLTAARQALAESDGAAAWMKGWEMSVEKAIETALRPDLP